MSHSICVTPLLMKSRFRVLALRLAPLNYFPGISARLRSNEGGGRSVFLESVSCALL